AGRGPLRCLLGSHRSRLRDRLGLVVSLAGRRGPVGGLVWPLLWRLDRLREVRSARPLLRGWLTLMLGLWRVGPLLRRLARLCGPTLGCLRLRRLGRPLLGDRPPLILWRGRQRRRGGQRLGGGSTAEAAASAVRATAGVSASEEAGPATAGGSTHPDPVAD